MFPLFGERSYGFCERKFRRRTTTANSLFDRFDGRVVVFRLAVSVRATVVIRLVPAAAAKAASTATTHRLFKVFDPWGRGAATTGRTGVRFVGALPLSTDWSVLITC